jgi:TetR/AcrR family transcriptional repressor of nem operon
MNRARRKTLSRERIIRAAARLLRHRGLRGPTVERVMSGAGLTVGGFYAHFRSKQALMASAFSRSSADAEAALLAGLEDAAPERWLRTVVRRYVTAGHRDASPALCALPVGVSEVARAGRGERQLYAEALGRLVTALEARAAALPAGGPPARERALGILLACVGGVALARATRGTPLSDELLACARRLGEGLARP